IFWKAPVESENKKLSPEEFQKYKKRARTICAIEACIIFTAAALGVPQIYPYYAVAGAATVAVLIVVPERA
ncbi:MAG: accessory gene regulator B family protein, partial [Clostridia bacterium]